MSKMWNLWHGCKKFSEGCKNCYVYRADSRHDKNPEDIHRTQSFDLPIRRDRKGEYKIKSGETIYTCFTSDFFVKDADEWRADAWKMMKERSDCDFFFITKRIERLYECLPDDWGNGYRNVAIGVTCENQKRADQRLPILKSAPIIKKIIICEPLLEKINLSEYLGNDIIEVVAGGESGFYARECNYSWILDLKKQCKNSGITFSFKQTGTYFIKDGVKYNIARQYQHSQAKKAGINYQGLYDTYLPKKH